MPIGTQSTAILLKQYEPKITRKPKTASKNFWALFFETILFTIAATAVGAITGGIVSGIALAASATDLTAGIASFTTRVLTEFAINQTIDAAKGEISAKNTALNLLLPIAFNASQISRGYRLTKILRLAKDTKTLQKLGVKEARNIQEVIKQLTNTKFLTKEINGKKQLFNFGKLNREQLLQDLGFVAQESFKFNFSTLTATEIKENLLLQVNLAKLSPKLLPKLKINDIENVNRFLLNFNTDYETVIKMNQFDWLHLVSEIQKTNSGKSLVLTLQQIRNSTVKYNFNSRIISNSLNKINRTFKYLNINYYVNRGLEKIWKNKKYFSKIKEKVLIINSKIETLENKALSKVDNLMQKGKKIFTHGEQLAIERLNLIPLDSPVFLACQINPLTLGNAVITIYHKDSRYDPIQVTDTIAKAETFVAQEHPFTWYWYESGWPIGYGVNKNSILQAIRLIPGTAAREALRINFQIQRIVKKVDAIKNYNFDFNFDFKKTLINVPINFFLRKTLTNRSTKLLIPIINKNINHRRNNFNNVTINRSSQYLKRKLKRRVRRW